MVHYRLYLLDRRGHFRAAMDLECEADDEAVDAARRQLPEGRLELWQGHRRVATLEGPSND